MTNTLHQEERLLKILNMAIADLIVTIFMMPFSLLFLHLGPRWIGGTFGEISCNIVYFSCQVSVPASIAIVMVVSVDRFFAVVYRGYYIYIRHTWLGHEKPEDNNASESIFFKISFGSLSVRVVCICACGD